MMTAVEISKEDGVRDLPIGCRLWFARALLAERTGEPLQAALCLDKALAAEQAFREQQAKGV